MALNNFDYLISWSNFIKVSERPLDVNEDAAIDVVYPQNYDLFKNGNNPVKVLNLNVDIGIALPESWVINSEVTNMDLLNHEQGHFNITALGAREFYNKLNGTIAKNEDELNKIISKLREGLRKKLYLVNERYDSQTKHSQDKALQKKWDIQIEKAKASPKGNLDQLPL